MDDSESPTGRYRISTSAWEVRMSLWIESPTIMDSSSGKALLSFRDPHWSLDSAEWLTESVVVLRMRKYPGNHQPPQVSATVDCAARTAEVGTAGPVPLGRLERSLDRALTWVQYEQPGQAERGVRAVLRKFFGL